MVNLYYNLLGREQEYIQDFHSMMGALTFEDKQSIHFEGLESIQ